MLSFKKNTAGSAIWSQEKIEITKMHGNRKSHHIISRAIRMKGVVNFDILKKTLGILSAKHDALRTRYVLDPEQAFERKVQGEISPPLISCALSEKSSGEILEYIRTFVNEPFDATAPLLWRAALLHISGQESVLALSFALPIMDAQSVSILLRDIDAIYQALSADKEAPGIGEGPGYADFAQGVHAWQQGDGLKKAQERLRHELEKKIPLAHLEGALRRSVKPQTEARLFPGVIEKDDAALLKRVAVLHGVSIPELLMSVTGMLLHRVTGKKAFFIASGCSNRHYPGAKEIVGHLATTVAHFFEADPALTLSGILKRTRKDLFAATNFYGFISQAAVGEIATNIAKTSCGAEEAVRLDNYMVDILIEKDADRFCGFESGKIENIVSPGFLSNEFKFIFFLKNDDLYKMIIRTSSEKSLDAQKILDFEFRNILESLEETPDSILTLTSSMIYETL